MESSNLSLRQKLFGPTRSLREKLGAAAEVVGTGAVALASKAGNPLKAAAGAIGSVVGDGTIGTPMTEEEMNKLEIETQIETNRKMGFASDENGNIAGPINNPMPSAITHKPAVITDTPPAPAKTQPKSSVQANFDKTQLRFQEATVGNGLPYVELPDGPTPITDVQIDAPLTQEIKHLRIVDPEEGEYVVDTPEKLAVANEIKRIADAIAPEYTDYLLRLAQKEGGYNPKARNADNAGGGVDRGIFQINSDAFPSVTDEMADDIKFSVLWAVSLIESANPVKGDGQYSGQEKWMADPAVRRSRTEIEYDAALANRG